MADIRGGMERMARMTSADLLSRVIAYCRDTRMAETTFGRRSVNDGKLVSRLRNGRTVSMRTADRVEAFIADYPVGGAPAPKAAPPPPPRQSLPPLPPEQNFRFFDNRQKY